MAQFYNAPSNFAIFVSGRQALAIGAHNLVQNNGKRIFFFSQNWSDNNAKKNKLQDF